MVVLGVFVIRNGEWSFALATYSALMLGIRYAVFRKAGFDPT